eukprot:gene5428-7518_t
MLRFYLALLTYAYLYHALVFRQSYFMRKANIWSKLGQDVEHLLVCNKCQKQSFKIANFMTLGSSSSENENIDDMANFRKKISSGNNDSALNRYLNNENAGIANNVTTDNQYPNFKRSNEIDEFSDREKNQYAEIFDASDVELAEMEIGLGEMIPSTLNNAFEADLESTDTPTLEDLFGYNGGVEYYDELINYSKDPSKSYTEVALMPFSTPFFASAKEFMYIYEMRFRELMYDVEKEENILGRCFVLDGKIGSIGSLCKVVESKRLEDGRGFFVISAYDRCKIVHIIQSSPYLRAIVELDYHDIKPLYLYRNNQTIATDNPNDDINNEYKLAIQEARICEELCHDVLILLKIYLRIAKLELSLSIIQDPKNIHHLEQIILPPAVLQNRPQIDTEQTLQEQYQRFEAFSLACANLISTEPEIMQQLQQTRSTIFRLNGLKRILNEAVDELSALLMADGILKESSLKQIKEQSNGWYDDISDLKPSMNYDGVTIRSALTEELIQDLGIKNFDIEHFLSTLNNYNSNSNNNTNNSNADENSNEDIWNGGIEAFQ